MSRFQLLNAFKRSDEQPAHHGRTAAVWAVIDTQKMRFVLVGVIVLLGMVYLWLVNSSATAGFYLSDLEDRVFTLQADYQKLVLEETELTSLSHLENQSEQMKMVASGRADYVSGATSVALVDAE